MKHVNSFNTFLTNTVNLNQSRINTLVARSETVINFIKQNELLDEYFSDALPQGSWAHRTIIKPQPNKEFDADIRIYLNPIPDWQPKDYIENMYQMFRENKTYKNMVGRKTRCLYLNYAGDFHLDIVPCIVQADEYFVIDRHENVFEKTDGQGYADWFKEQNAIVGNNHLIKVVRIAKFIRDTKRTFTTKSILLTTLLAMQISDNENEEDFKDLPTSLKTIFNRLDQYLQSRPTMPIVDNPALPGEENFNRHWNQDLYTIFREKFNYYTQKINTAFDKTDREGSIKKWREVLGDDFGVLLEEKSVSIDRTATVFSAPARPWSPCNDN